MIQLSQELKEFFGKTALLQNLSDESLEHIAKVASSQTFQPGDWLFSDGDECHGSFMILSGQVKVFKYTESSREQIMGLLGPGEYLAGVPAFDGHCYTACAIALEAVVTLYLPREPMLELLQQDAKLAFNLLKIFSQHLREFAHLIENLSLKEVSGRLATYLLLLSYQSGNTKVVELEMTKAQLAAFIGTVPETLSRSLQKMDHEGLLMVDGSKITILNFPQLQKLARCRSSRCMP